MRRWGHRGHTGLELRFRRLEFHRFRLRLRFRLHWLLRRELRGGEFRCRRGRFGLGLGLGAVVVRSWFFDGNRRIGRRALLRNRISGLRGTVAARLPIEVEAAPGIGLLDRLRGRLPYEVADRVDHLERDVRHHTDDRTDRPRGALDDETVEGQRATAHERTARWRHRSDTGRGTEAGKARTAGRRRRPAAPPVTTAAGTAGDSRQTAGGATVGPPHSPTTSGPGTGNALSSICANTHARLR
ncbi:hypothetical protein P9209_10795 [Prescottella defluvii]|nr:hypothetical protein P9209_10795 [Prescottella defluvii]